MKVIEAQWHKTQSQMDSLLKASSKDHRGLELKADRTIEREI